MPASVMEPQKIVIFDSAGDRIGAVFCDKAIRIDGKLLHPIEQDVFTAVRDNFELFYTNLKP